ncbi:MAG: PilZ domain-containing protein [Bdellovibrionales bacterium]|nr:PilZ domain-containing protein [Bdellovibrionales bacterium]
MNNTIDHTPAPRLPLNMEVSFRRSYARNSVSGHLRNISLTGAFLETTSSALAASDKIIVTFIVSGRKRNISATIVWKNNVGCGLKFQPFNNRDVQIVDDLMYFVESTRESRKSVLNDIIKRVS